MSEKSASSKFIQEVAQEEEISLEEIIEAVKEGWRWVVYTAAACAFASVVYALFAPAKYLATGYMQGALVLGAPIEAPNLLAEKLKTPLYYSADTYRMCDLEDSPTPGEHLVKELRPGVNKNAPVVSLSFKGSTPDAAKKCLASVLSDVRANQKIFVQPVIDAKKAQLTTLQDKLRAAETVSRQISGKSLRFDFTDPKFSAAALLTATLMSKDTEIKDLRYQIGELERGLLAPQTQEATFISPVYASDVRAEPRRTMIVLLSTLVGLLLGTGLLMLQRYRTQRSKRPLSAG